MNFATSYDSLPYQWRGLHTDSFLSEDANLGEVYEELYPTLTMARLNPETSAHLFSMLRRCAKACLGMQSRDRAFAEALMFAESRIGQLGRNLARYLDRAGVDAEDALAGKESTLPARLMASRTTAQLKGTGAGR